MPSPHSYDGFFWEAVLCKCFEETFDKTQWRKVKQVQPVWLCILSCKQFEGTFENAQWRKAKQMQQVWLCLSSYWQFEDSFENAQWRKINKFRLIITIKNSSESVLMQINVFKLPLQSVCVIMCFLNLSSRFIFALFASIGILSTAESMSILLPNLLLYFTLIG